MGATLAADTLQTLFWSGDQSLKLQGLAIPQAMANAFAPWKLVAPALSVLLSARSGLTLARLKREQLPVFVLHGERDQVVPLAAARDASAMGLMTMTSGNFSARDPESGLIAITPSGRRYETMTAADIVLVQLDGTVVDGLLKPSSETPLHLGVILPNFGPQLAAEALADTAVAAERFACGAHERDDRDHNRQGEQQAAFGQHLHVVRMRLIEMREAAQMRHRDDALLIEQHHHRVGARARPGQPEIANDRERFAPDGQPVGPSDPRPRCAFVGRGDAGPAYSRRKEHRASTEQNRTAPEIHPPPHEQKRERA